VNDQRGSRGACSGTQLLTQTTSTFDVTAPSFDQYRALPHGAPEAIRKAIFQKAAQQQMRVLDLGAGTGRIGKAFVAANDSYVGLDSSWAMLREFLAHSPTACLLQSDGQQLPFAGSAFDVVMLMQVLSGAQDWQALLHEVRRVLRPRGVVVVGHTTTPSSGIDSQLKRRLSEILSEMGIAWHEPQKARRQSLAWLESSAARRSHVTAASWTAERAPQEFLVRHRTGARFAALPVAVQEEALQKLSVWAEAAFGALDTAYSEEHAFELEIFEF
jgi:ubiquinone/menaquinone biosynthesis C-methylase UbiE